MHPSLRSVLALLFATLILQFAPVIGLAQTTPPLEIVTQPASTSCFSGASAALTVAAKGTTPLSYQWYRGTPGDVSSQVLGATGRVLVTPPLTASASFWVRVADTSGSVGSPAATVTVQPRSSTLFAAGNNAFGQLGDGSGTNRTTPVLIATGISFACGGEASTHFVTDTGALGGMGRNTNGQLGDGSTTNQSSPVAISVDVASAADGASHGIFIKNDGTLWGMGSSQYGQAGFGASSVPTQISAGVVSASAGWSHTHFIKTDGSLWAMGRNSTGQLGIGFMFSDMPVPVQVATGGG
jgi:alpha-tubulin suppressor-like RCC1 family protein